jgi:hypothetical protein
MSLGSRHTIKLVAATQSRTATTTEDTFSIAQGAHVRAIGLAQAVLVGEGNDLAAYVGSHAGDAMWQEAFVLVRTVGAGPIEWQRNRRGFGSG